MQICLFDLEVAMSFNALITRVAATIPGEEITNDQMIFYMVIGAVLAFAAIGLLWAVLSVFKKVFGGSSRSSGNEPSDPCQSAPVVSGGTAYTAPANDAQLIAVLTAAVAAYMAEENGAAPDPNSFRVVSFKRVSSGRAWNSK